MHAGLVYEHLGYCSDLVPNGENVLVPFDEEARQQFAKVLDRNSLEHFRFGQLNERIHVA